MSKKNERVFKTEEILDWEPVLYGDEDEREKQERG